MSEQNSTGALYERLLDANQYYATQFDRSRLAMPPAKKLAIVVCMDARLTVEELLGLKTGDAHIIRNAGGIITEDALRSLIISHHLLGTDEFMMIHHTDCGMLKFKDEDGSSEPRPAVIKAEKFGLIPTVINRFSNNKR